MLLAELFYNTLLFLLCSGKMLMQNDLPQHWQTDDIIHHLDSFGFCIIENAYSSEYLQQVRSECIHHLTEFKNAAIQNGVMNQIRSDHILWINDGELPLAQQHLDYLKQLGQIFNQNFYLGIKEVEAHFACYNIGEFYGQHRDNPHKKNNRMISSVFYLHDQWESDWGGELRLQDRLDQWHTISPQPNRITIFQSDLLHEVLVSKQQRLSITAWLRSDVALF